MWTPVLIQTSQILREPAFESDNKFVTNYRQAFEQTFVLIRCYIDQKTAGFLNKDLAIWQHQERGSVKPQGRAVCLVIAFSTYKRANTETMNLYSFTAQLSSADVDYDSSIIADAATGQMSFWKRD